MQIDPKDLEEFKQLYRAEFGQELTESGASEIAGNLVSLYELLSEPLPFEIDEAKRQTAEEERPAPSSAQGSPLLAFTF